MTGDQYEMGVTVEVSRLGGRHRRLFGRTPRPDDHTADHTADHPGEYIADHSSVSALVDRSVAWARRRPQAFAVGALGAAVVAVASCLLAGLPPLLPFAVVLLAYAVVRPVAGLVFALVVFCAPLGLWMLGIQALAGWVFGGRSYALSLAAAFVVFALLAVNVLERPKTRRLLVTGAVAGVLLLLWTLIGIAAHGVAQTLVGGRFVLFPLVMLAVLVSLSAPATARLITVSAWLLVANGIAAVGELIVGPARLASWGFEQDRAIRYIDGTFRVPGLTEFNAELGMLAGAYLLGYVALWLTGSARPGRLAWHAGAVAAAVCLALSTSRSGALLLAAGVVAGAVLNRAGGAAGRRRSQLVGIGVLVLVAAGFAAVGATGSSSLFQRFGVWSSLLTSGTPVYGDGFGAVGAATTSRIASGPQVFVDNYFVSVALQCGPVALAALLVLVVVLLVRLWRRSDRHAGHVVHIAVLAGLACSCLVLEAWEYAGAMSCLALFVAHARRLDDQR